MAKLNQIIAIEKGIKSRVHSEISELYKIIQKAELFNGFSKTYQKKDEESESLPSENKRVQYFVNEVLRSVERSISELFDVTARKDYSNCNAVANIVIEEVIILKDVPVSFFAIHGKTNYRYQDVY